jgi:hypothetical protein
MPTYQKVGSNVDVDPYVGIAERFGDVFEFAAKGDEDWQVDHRGECDKVVAVLLR